MKVLIWDYNGTILDDTEMCVKIENMMLEERGMKHDYSVEEYKRVFQFPVINYYEFLGYDFEKESYDHLSVVYHDLYDRHFDEVKLTEGFLEKITEAISKGYHNVIISACRQDKLLEQTKYFGIDKYFDKMIGTDNLYGGSKIEIALNWMKESGVSPQDCMYIGDTTHDKETADALGVKNCVLIAEGHQSFERLSTVCENVKVHLKDVEL